MLSQFLFLYPSDIFLFYASLVVLGIASIFGNKADRLCIILLNLAVAIAILICYSDLRSYSFSVSMLDFHEIQFMYIFSRLMIYLLLLANLSSAIKNSIHLAIGKKEFYFLSLWSAMGLVICIDSDNFATFFVGLELYSIPMYTICAFSENNKSSESAVKAFIFGAFASGIILMAIALTYMSVGSFKFDQSLAVMHYNSHQGIIISTMFFIGIIVKIGIFPFHQWSIDMYQGAPIASMHYVGVISKVGLMFIMILKFPIMFPVNYVTNVSLILGTMSVAVGSISAVFQTNLKRVLGLSSVAHLGYCMIAIGINDFPSAYFYIMIYAVLSTGIMSFLYLVKINGKDIESVSNLNGLGNITSAKVVIMFAVLIIALSGMPPFVGFFGKIYILISTFKENMYLVALILAVSSVISAVYYFRLIVNMFFINSDINVDSLRLESNYLNTIIITLCAIISILYITLPFDLHTIIYNIMH